MLKVLLVLHDGKDYIRMNKVFFEELPIKGQYIVNSDGLAYLVEEVTTFANYVTSKGAIGIVVVHQAPRDEPVSQLYGLNIEEDLDD
ncbi:LysR family transcriptional regulator [Agrilactobacillus fermenti]|uniref:LysR family transcriptional regulator n=1 Tax=Agrilactobacillus fermenti TaxID=2586909 RepID=UPI001E41AF88|nr:LysR family transcriptional regulator [Agrilactobacillus fermenti]MCD2257016.1 LysR family transcriptional regulator [Agrilactobacillus fermenti]